MAELYLARIESKSGRPERSLERISETLARNPDWPPAVNHAIRLQLQLGQKQDGRRTIEKIRNINRYSNDDLLNLWRLVSSHAPELTVLLTDKLLNRETPAGGEVSMRKPVQTDGVNPLYRFGFICFSTADHPDGDRTWAEIVTSWRTLDIAGFVIYRHHETPLHYHRGESGSAILIGHAFTIPPQATIEASLRGLLAAQTDDLFYERLNGLSGRFALLLLRDSGQHVFHDPFGSRSLFYRSTGAFCVASHAELIANAFGHRRSPAVRELMATDRYTSRSVKYLPGDLTVYEDLYALAPNNYYDIADRQTVRYWPRHNRGSTTFDEFFSELDDHFIALVSYLRSRYLPILGVTGGIDSRAILAAFRRHGLRVSGVTWLGTAEEREMPSILTLAAYTGIEHTYMRFRGTTDHDSPEVAAAAMRNGGNYRDAAGAGLTVRMYQRYAGRSAVYIRGYGAEIIRGFYHVLKRPISAMTASELLRAYGAPFSRVRTGQIGDEHARRIALAAFEGFMERANYDERLVRSGFDLNDVFYWEHRMGMWGAGMHNEMDPAVLSLTGFNSRKVYEAAFGMDPGERLTKELLLEVIRRYDETMAEIPYF